MWLAAKRTLPFFLACAVSYSLEHFVLERIAGHDESSPIVQGLFGFSKAYGYAISAWPREMKPRFTAIVHIDPDSDATARGLANNVCQQRGYIAALLPGMAERQPTAIVIDKYFTSTGCNLEEPTKSLKEAIARVATSVPVVVGVMVDTRGTTLAADAPPLLIPAVAFVRSPSLKEAIVNLDIVPRRIPLGWTVRERVDGLGEWRNGIALEAALLREPRLFETSPRLMRLKDERDNPFASMIGEQRFVVLQAGDILCTDVTTAPAFKTACAEQPRSGTDPSFLKGRIVILGESGHDVDRHETSVIGRVPGTVLQANYIEALLDDRYFVPAPDWVDYLVGFLFFVALEASLRGHRAWLSLGRVALIVVGTFGLLSFTARQFGYYVDPAVSVLVLVFMLIGWSREMITRIGGKST
jgi:CHASE2 domain-containing sensor protein